MLFPSHVVPLRVYILSFSFGFHTATVYDLHMTCHAHAAPMPCSDHAVLKATSQGHGTARQGHGMGTTWQV
jgi:hypothetical protein